MIDVLIASYNCEDTIETCIERIPLEILGYIVRIIVVDDCSTDTTYEKLRNISRIDLLLRNKSNIGVGGTRKKLLEVAESKYVLFLDADDYMVMSRPSLKGNVTELSEVVLLKRDIPTRKKATDQLNELFRSYGELNELKTATLLQDLISKKTMLPECWGYIFSREFIDSNKISFPSSRVCEDIVFMTEVLTSCSSFMFSDELSVVKSTSDGVSRGIGEDYIRGAGIALVRILSMKVNDCRRIVRAYQDLVVGQLTREFATYTLWPAEKPLELEVFINDCLAVMSKNEGTLKAYEETIASIQGMIREAESMFRAGYNIYIWFLSPLSTTICEYLAYLDCKVMMIVDDVRNGFRVTTQDVAACSYKDHALVLRELENTCILIPTFNVGLCKSIEERYSMEDWDISFIRLGK